MEIVRLGDKTNAQESARQSQAGLYQARMVLSQDQIAGVERVTLFRQSPSQRTCNRDNHDIAGESSFQPYGLFLDENRESNLPASNEVRSVNRIVGGLWVAACQFDESDLHLRIALSEHQRWLFAARLLPDVRGRGAYSTLLREVFSSSVMGVPKDSKHVIELEETADSKNATGVWAAINPANHRSMRAHARFQIANAGRVHVLRMGPFAIGWRSRTPAGLKITMSPKWTFRGSHSPIQLRIQIDCPKLLAQARNEPDGERL